MKRNILLLCMLTMLVLMVYTNVDHLIWLTSDSHSSSNLVDGVFPLLINNVIWLALIPLFLIWKVKKKLPTYLFILMIVTVIVQISTTVYSHIAVDPQAAGLPFIIVTIPLSILLLIFSVKELKA